MLADSNAGAAALAATVAPISAFAAAVCAATAAVVLGMDLKKIPVKLELDHFLCNPILCYPL